MISKYSKKKDINKGFTHSGRFHADDVFSSALLKMLNSNIVIQRGNIVPDDFDGIIYDIGKGEYDHHQKDKEYRDNGIPYAAFGLLWRKFGYLFLENEEDVKKFDKEFVEPIDFADNTGEYHELSQVICDFNLSWNEEGKSDERFFKALDFAKTILENRFKEILSKRKAQEEVQKLIKNQKGKILEMERFYPWKGVVCHLDKLYVIFPSARGGYMIQAVPEKEDEMTLKKAFPVEWRGKEQEQLKEITGIETFTFCHSSGFICAADTLEDARKVAKLACEK